MTWPCAARQVGQSLAGTAGSLAGTHDPQEDVPFDDVRLGGLLGKGSFGSVYIGLAAGTPCAVKVRRGGEPTPWSRLCPSDINSRRAQRCERE